LLFSRLLLPFLDSYYLFPDSCSFPESCHLLLTLNNFPNYCYFFPDSCYFHDSGHFSCLLLPFLGVILFLSSLSLSWTRTVPLCIISSHIFSRLLPVLPVLMPFDSASCFLWRPAQGLEAGRSPEELLLKIFTDKKKTARITSRGCRGKGRGSGGSRQQPCTPSPLPLHTPMAHVSMKLQLECRVRAHYQKMGRSG
jgi:hypothetical protein